MPLEQIRIADTLQRGAGFGKSRPGRTRYKGAYQFLVGKAVFTQHSEWIVMAGL